MVSELQKFMDDFKSKIEKSSAVSPPQTSTSAAAVSTTAAPGVELEVPGLAVKVDAVGFAVQPVQDGKAGVCAEPEQDGEYQGIGGKNGVIVGESRERML